jgi:hypothetical protein
LEAPWYDEMMDIISEYAIKYNLQHNGGEIVSPDEIPAIQVSLPSREETMIAIESLPSRRPAPVNRILLMTLQAQHGDDLFRIAQSTLICLSYR